MAIQSSRSDIGQRVQQRDIADRAGVSISTVSRVLNNVDGISEDVKQRVRHVAAELGYAATRQRGAGKLNHVHLWSGLDGASHVLDPFHTDVLAGVEQECERQGLRLSYSFVDQWPGVAEQLQAKVADARIDGLLLLAISEQPVVERMLALKLPVVLVNDEHFTLPIDTLLPDNRGGPLLAMQHLLSHGHRRILHITYPQRPTIRRRHEGYRLALEAAGLPYDPALVCNVTLGIDTVYAAIKQRLATRGLDFSAVFGANDVAAIGAMSALQEAGYRVPEDVSVVGFDDLPRAGFLSPPLTTVRVEREELGSRAVRCLLDRAATPAATPVRLELATRLIERQSVADAPHSSATMDDR